MSQAVFLTGSLMRHVAVMSFTASIGIAAVFAVDFVDMIFISMLAQLATPLLTKLIVDGVLSDAGNLQGSRAEAESDLNFYAQVTSKL